MENTALTPEESLSLITKTIQDTKQRFKENGHIYILWGILVFVASMSQFILLRLDFTKIHGYPYLIMPLGAIYTYIYYWKRAKTNRLQKSVIGSLLKGLGIILAVNFILLGFLFGSHLGSSLVPIFLILLAFWAVLSGISIQSRPLIISGILLNLIGFATFYIDWQYHPLIMAIASVIGLIVPGILLNQEK